MAEAFRTSGGPVPLDRPRRQAPELSQSTQNEKLVESVVDPSWAVMSTSHTPGMKMSIGDKVYVPSWLSVTVTVAVPWFMYGIHGRMTGNVAPLTGAPEVPSSLSVQTPVVSVVVGGGDASTRTNRNAPSLPSWPRFAE